MVQKRQHLFETNSSSTHTIVIANNSDDDFKNGLPKQLEFKPGQFGWELDRHQTVEERASYLFTAILCNSMCKEYIPIITETLKKWDIEAVFPKIIKKHYAYTKTAYEAIKDDNGFYYVDHCGLLEDFIRKVCNDEVLLMNYLFSDESFIVTGNDNDDECVDDTTKAKNILLDYYKGN